MLSLERSHASEMELEVAAVTRRLAGAVGALASRAFPAFRLRPPAGSACRHEDDEQTHEYGGEGGGASSAGGGGHSRPVVGRSTGPPRPPAGGTRPFVWAVLAQTLRKFPRRGLRYVNNTRAFPPAKGWPPPLKGRILWRRSPPSDDKPGLNYRPRCALPRDDRPDVPAVRYGLEFEHASVEFPISGNRDLRPRRFGRKDERISAEELHVVAGCTGRGSPCKPPRRRLDRRTSAWRTRQALSSSRSVADPPTVRPAGGRQALRQSRARPPRDRRRPCGRARSRGSQRGPGHRAPGAVQQRSTRRRASRKPRAFPSLRAVIAVADGHANALH